MMNHENLEKIDVEMTAQAWKSFQQHTGWGFQLYSRKHWESWHGGGSGIGQVAGRRPDGSVWH